MGSEVGPTVLWGMSSVAFGSLWGSRKLDKKRGRIPLVAAATRLPPPPRLGDTPKTPNVHQLTRLKFTV